MRIAVTILLIVLLVLVLLVGATPALLSSGPGTRTAVGFVNDAIPGTLEIESLSLRWLGGQRIEGLELRDPQERPVATLETLSTELTLWEALRQRLSLGETLIRAPRLELIVDQAGRDNLSAALGLDEAAPAENETPGPIVLPVTANMVLEEGQVTITGPGAEPVILEAISAGLRLEPPEGAVDSAPRDLAFELDARNRQGELSGSIALTGRISHLLDASGRPTPERSEIELDGTIDELPLAAADQLLGQDGLLLAALGDRLSAQLSGAGRELTLEAQMPLASLRLAGSLTLDDADRAGFTLSDTAQLRWRLTPALVAAGAEGGDDAATPPLALAEAVDLTLALERLDLPLAGFDPSAVALAARLDTGAPLRFTGGGLETVTLRDPGAELASENLAERLELRASASIEEAERSGHLRIDGALESLFDAGGRLQSERLRADATASLSEMPVALLDRLAGADGLLTAALGPRLELEASARSGGDGDAVSTDMTLELGSETLATGAMRLRLDEQLRLAEPATLRYRLRPALVEALAAGGENDAAPAATLQAPADIELALETLSLPLPGADAPWRLDEGRLAATLSAGTLALADAEGVATRLEGLRVSLDGDPLSRIALQVNGTLSQDEPGALATFDASPLELDATSETTLAADGTLGDIEGSVTLDGAALSAELPWRLSDDFATFELGPDAALTLTPPAPYDALTGPELALSGEARLGLAEPFEGSASLAVASEQLNGDLALELAEALTLARPAELRLELTPAGYAALPPAAEDDTEADAEALQLAAETAIEARIERLRWPLAAADRPGSDLPDLEAGLAIGELLLEDGATGERFGLDGLSVTLTGDAAAERLQLALSGALQDAGDGQRGELALDADLQGGFDEAGAFDADALTLAADGRLEGMPSAVIDRFLDLDGMVAAALGPQSDASLETRLERGEGPMDITLQAANAEAQMRAQWNEGTLTLREAFTAEVTPTPEFGELVLSMLHPIFETMEARDEPVRFEMPTEGVSIPIRDYALEGLAIPEMRLTLGTVVLDGGWMLEGVTGIAQRFGRLEGRGDRWEAEFTPMIASLAEGQVEYLRRLDVMLDERIHLASWGRLDLMEESADLVLAVMPYTLRTVFRINVAEDDALRIPVRGPIGAGAVDFSRVGTEIGRLRAREEASERSALLGAIAGAVAGGGGGDGDIPAPSVSPLPWQERIDAAAEEAAREQGEATEEEEGDEPSAGERARDLIDVFR